MAKALILCMAILVSGCQSTSGNFCQIETPEYLSPSEIDAIPAPTLRRIDNRNEIGEKICGWKASGI